MFVLLFILWLIFNGRFTAEVVVSGVVFSAALTVFGQKICGWSFKADRMGLRMAGTLLVYAGSLFVEILKANLAVIKIILSPRLSGVAPRLFFFDSHLKTNGAKTALANSITITPGTYTLGIYDGTFAVHALNGEFEAGTPESGFDHRLMAMEALVEKEAQK